ncbi:hypothetical protein NBRC111894_4529 [Sporolactobacillus inulinus]|uniref:Uncharacterized protein n=1 Tax=Sporolactobacillus inulinus TaxID=2078 RepID=A0A4Y1ZIQ7_9BACL|nr:hypothetical protein NBRC111894_4529 [Sporolactobacillus inulinus]
MHKIIRKSKNTVDTHQLCFSLLRAISLSAADTDAHQRSATTK